MSLQYRARTEADAVSPSRPLLSRPTAEPEGQPEGQPEATPETQPDAEAASCTEQTRAELAGRLSSRFAARDAEAAAAASPEVQAEPAPEAVSEPETEPLPETASEADPTAASIFEALGGTGEPNTEGFFRTRCPVRDHSSGPTALALKDFDRGFYVKCWAGCTDEEIKAALVEQGIIGEGQVHLVSELPRGLTLTEYAEAKGLPESFLEGLGLRNETRVYPAGSVRVPYSDENGRELAVRYRLALGGPNRFRWRAGDRPCLYGLPRLAEARKTGAITIVEGESDCHTLWYAGFKAVGLPGATGWREDRDAPLLAGFEKIYVVLEPDSGGQAVIERLRKSEIRDRVWLVTLPEATKDPSALFLSNPTHFAEAWRAALAGATSWSAYEAAGDLAARAEAEKQAERLLACDDVLTAVEKVCHELGVTGESRLVRLTYLSATTRLFERPVSLVVKGPSAAGKSFTVGTPLRLFPEDALIQRTGMSEKALIYSKEPLSHRMLVIYEAAALAGADYLTMIIRTLLSEGRIRYEVVVGDPQSGFTTVSIVRPGPTGLILTTTQIEIDPETDHQLSHDPVVPRFGDNGPGFVPVPLRLMQQGVSSDERLQGWKISA